MLAAFVCLNVLIGLILMWLTTAYYETFWKKLGDQEGDANNKTVQKSLYQAAVLVFCCANIFNFGVFVTACLFKHPNFDAADEVVITAFTLKMVMIPLLIFSHLLVTLFVVFGEPKPCESQSQSPAQKQVISKVLQVLALFNILIFIQTIATAFIPLFVYLLLYTYRILSALIFMGSGTFCLIVFVANLLHRSAAKIYISVVLAGFHLACLPCIYMCASHVLLALAQSWTTHRRIARVSSLSSPFRRHISC